MYEIISLGLGKKVLINVTLEMTGFYKIKEKGIIQKHSILVGEVVNSTFRWQYHWGTS